MLVGSSDTAIPKMDILCMPWQGWDKEKRSVLFFPGQSQEVIWSKVDEERGCSQTLTFSPHGQCRRASQA